MNSREVSHNLDLLRALAVGLVLAFHLELFFAHGVIRRSFLLGLGHWGVLLFFVHTSLVLMYSLERREARGAEAGVIVPFWVRRAFRIYPLSVGVVLAAHFFHLPVGHFGPAGFRAAHLTPVGLRSNLLLTQNLTGDESITAPLWSLPFEMQMYLVLPALYLLTRRCWTAMVGGGGWLLAVALAHVARVHDLPVYELIRYAPGFMAGVLAFELTSVRTLRLKSRFWPLALVFASALYLRSPWSDSNAWSATLLIGVLTPQFREIANPIVNRITSTIARYSYGVYLTHFILIWFCLQRLEPAAWPLRLLCFGTALVIVPAVLYHLVEAPMIRVGNRFASRLFPAKPAEPPVAAAAPPWRSAL